MRECKDGGSLVSNLVFNSMRIELFDILRGFSLIGMIIFHANYLIFHVFKFHYSLLSDWFLNIFGFIIALIFIVLSGYVNAMSYQGKTIPHIFKKSLHRFIILGMVALGISLITYTFFPEQRISWGIIHFFALSTLLQPFFSRSWVWIFVFLLISFFLSQVFAQLSIHSWVFIPFGILFKGYYSADYYPLFPWFTYILLGQAIQYLFRKYRVEKWLSERKFPKLWWIRFLGRHSLLVYVVHVPILYILISFLTVLL